MAFTHPEHERCRGLIACDHVDNARLFVGAQRNDKLIETAGEQQPSIGAVA